MAVAGHHPRPRGLHHDGRGGPAAEALLAAWEQLPPDPYGTVYGHFDGHGWNMAFDHAAETLTGIYDFADSGFGDLTQEFIYSDLVSPDLTDRIVARYTRHSGRQIDLDRVRLLTSVHRLTELADAIGDPRQSLSCARPGEAGWSASPIRRRQRCSLRPDIARWNASRDVVATGDSKPRRSCIENSFSCSSGVERKKGKRA